MVRVAFVFVLASIVAFEYAENTKCSGENEPFQKCQQSFCESQKADHQQEQADHRAKVKQCFTSSGCKEPTPTGASKGKGDGKQCHKDFSKYVHDLIKPCIQKKLEIVLQEDDHESDKPGQGGFSDLDDELKSFCTSDDQRKKTKACLKSLAGSGKVDKADREKKAKERFNANCGNKNQCFCILTKSAICDCAKSEIVPKADSLNQQLLPCIGRTPRPNKDGKKESFVNRYAERACKNVQKEDKCSKSYQPHSGEHGTVIAKRIIRQECGS